MMAGAISPNAPTYLNSPTLRPPSQGYMRSPKRAKSTPPTEDNPRLPSISGSISPYHSRHRSSHARGKMVDLGNYHRRPMTSERHMMTSSNLHVDQDGWSGPSRKRDSSVPFLSETLSAFSLDRVSPTVGLFPVEEQHAGSSVTASSPQITPTASPGHFSNFTPPEALSTSAQASSSPFPNNTPPHPFGGLTQLSAAEDLPHDHPHPHTAPLPQTSSFLGSPFSSKTARGDYNFRAFSPCKGTATEQIPQGIFGLEPQRWKADSTWALQVDLSRRLSSDSSTEEEDFNILAESISASTVVSTANSDDEESTESHMDVLPEQRTPCLRDSKAFESPQADSGENTSDREETQTASPLAHKTSTKSKASRPASSLRYALMPSSSSKSSLTPSDAPNKTSTDSSLCSLKLAHWDTASSIDSGRDLTSHFQQMAQTPTPGLPETTFSRDDSEDEDDFASPSTRPAFSEKRSLQSSNSAKKRLSLGAGLGFVLTRITDDASPFPKYPGLGFRAPSQSPSKTSADIASKRSSIFGKRSSNMKPSQSEDDLARSSSLKPTRPVMRRGVSETHQRATKISMMSSKPKEQEVVTPIPAAMAEARPSPAAFVSTGLMKKSSDSPRARELNITRTDPKVSVSGPEGRSPVKSRLKIMMSMADEHTDGTMMSDDDDSRSEISNFSMRSEVSLVSESNNSTTRSGKTGGRGLRKKISQMLSRKYQQSSKGSPQRVVGLGIAMEDPRTPRKGDLTSEIINTPPSGGTEGFQHPFLDEQLQRKYVDMSYDGTPPDSPSSSVSSPGESVKSFTSRVRDFKRGPILRMSNPFLAETYRKDTARLITKKAPEPNSDIAFVLKEGSRLQRQFNLKDGKPLGNGEYGQVWKVTDKRKGMAFAVKAGKKFSGTKDRLRQMEEVSILRQLSHRPHRNVIQFVESWEEESRLFILTELAFSGTLEAFLYQFADLGGLGESQVWKILLELSSGLRYIHECGIVHLDMKPANVLVAECGALKIADFGTAAVMSTDGTVGDVSPILPQNMRDGSFFWRDAPKDSIPVMKSPLLDREVEGDRAYLSPETLQSKHVGKEADMFALGIILLEVALKIDPPTGGEAWIKLRNDDFSDVLPHFILRGERPVPNGEINESTRQKVLSPQLVDVVKALMQSNAEERCTNDDLLVLGPIRRMRRMQRINPVRQERKSSSEGVRSSLLGKGQVKEKVDGRTVILPALAPQPEEWLAYILGEDNSRRSEEGRLSGDGSWRSGRSSLESAVWASGGSGVGRVQSIKWSASPVMRRNVELREEKARREASELKRRENGWKI